MGWLVGWLTCIHSYRSRLCHDSLQHCLCSLSLSLSLNFSKILFQHFHSPFETFYIFNVCNSLDSRTQLNVHTLYLKTLTFLEIFDIFFPSFCIRCFFCVSFIRNISIHFKVSKLRCSSHLKTKFERKCMVRTRYVRGVRRMDDKLHSFCFRMNWLAPTMLL